MCFRLRFSASEKDVNKLWETFNDVAEGFGLNQDEMCEICRALQPTLEIHSKAEIDQLTVALFTALDTDEVTCSASEASYLVVSNGLVDALEFLGTIAVMSAMTIAQKLTFVYNCYDFSETGQVSIDELTLALKSTLTGLCKVASDVLCPTELVLEDVVLHAFRNAQKNSPNDFITLHEFPKFAETTPEMTSRVDFFDCPDEHQNVVANAAPSAPPTINPSLPAASLDLDWVYGFNSDFRNVVKYISPAEIVYPAGSVVVVYDVIEHKQRFALHHSDLVQTLAVHPTHKSIIASGERGLVPKIVVWNTQALGSTLSVLRGFHKHGVRHLAWMPNGRTLVSIGQGDFHCVTVCQWEKGTSVEWTKPAVLVFADRCGHEAVHACIMTTSNHFVTCGQRHLFFWSRESEDRYSSDYPVFYKRRGVLGRKAKMQTLLSAASLPNDLNLVLVGTARGQILLFEGRNCVKVIHAHASAVNVLQSFPGGILSTGKDGKIRLWSKRMEPGAQFDIETLGSISSRVRSLSAPPDGGAKLLITTSGAEIYEIATSDGSNLHFGAVLCGHFAYELHGLAVNPLKRVFCTTGDDRTVRIWDMSSHRQLRMTTLDAPSQTCAYSPDGSLLAIGQGADDTNLPSTKQKKCINANKQGAFAMLSENGLAVKYETKDSKKHIRNVKFAGDGLTLAVGSSDNFIYTYNTEDWASKGKCKARDASAVLSHFDFSLTGEYTMASVTNKGEMAFFETASGVETTRIATLKDVEWLSWTCPYGWRVQGAWSSVQSTNYEVSAIDRTASSQENARISTQLLVVGDNFGSLRLCRYPCVATNSLSQVCQGASSAISAMRFSAGNSVVVACAKEERCIFQWRIEYEEDDTVGGDGTGSTQADIADNKTDGNAALVAASSPPTKPWVSSSIAPSDAPDETDLELSAVPNENLELEWVYGYRCHDVRNNLFLTKSKAYLVYPAANVVVIQDIKLLGKKGLLQSFLSVVFCGKDAIVGATSGDLYRFKGIELASIVPAHSRSVATLYCVPKAPHHIVSGGKDGAVKLWSSDLECLAEFGEFNSRKHAIRSVFWDFDCNVLLVGTLGSSTHQISSLDGSIITPRTPDGADVSSIENHFRKELHGLSICPSKDCFCTTGDDGILRVWDLLRHIQVLAKELDTSSRACVYSYDGDFVAVGLGSGGIGKRHKKDASLLVFEERTLSVELVYETRDTKQSISVIKHSPDDQSLVAGSLDNSIYIYVVPSNYTKRAVFTKHKSFITHLGISSDSQYIRSKCGRFELLFADITAGSHVASATALRNQNSASLPGTSPETSEAVLVAGTSHGTLNLFKFPCFVRGAGYKTYFGHSGGIALVEFSSARNGGAHCISIEKSDRCIFQWRKTRAKITKDTSGGGGIAPVVKDPEEDVDITTEGLFLPESFINIAQEEIKPYLSAIIPPSTGTKKPSEQDGAAGKCAFTLEQVFGFRTYDMRNNVVYSKTKHQSHSRPILSLAASRDGSYVATGEICSENLQQEHPRIHIWEPTSCTNATILSECHTKAVSYLAFSSNGKLLASIGQDEHHSLAVYASSSGHWFDGALLATAKTTRHDVLFVAFVDDSSSSSYHVVSGGNHHVLFWRLDPPSLVGTFGVFGARAQSQPVLCGASLGAAVVTGCSTGHLYVWESCAVSKAVPAHNGAVYALHATKEGYVSGGRDGHIRLWSQTMAPLADFDVNGVKPASQNAIVRSVCWDIAEDRVLIGTKGGEILGLSRLTKETSLVTESHYDHNGLYGLSAHPQRPELIATVGEDQTVRVWDLNRRQVVAKVTLDGSLRCVIFSPDGKWLAVGFGGAEHTGGVSKSGAFVILDAQTLEVVHEGRDSKQSAADIKFSPDLTLLALGSIDHCVYFYSTLDNFSLQFKFPKAKGRITHMDFAADSSALRVNSEAWELLYVSTLDGSQVTTPSSMKDVTWATESCVFSWSAQGIWDFARPEEYFHTLTKAHTQELLASGNNKGEIRVYNAPCLSKRTGQHVLRGHGMNVSNVVFTCDDSRLVTIGANDKSVFVWRVC
ncbi:Microtubule-associated protein, partial [Globisporangium splendens]